MIKIFWAALFLAILVLAVFVVGLGVGAYFAKKEDNSKK